MPRFRSIFAPAFLEVEFDQAGPIILSDADFIAARQQGVDDAKKNQSKLGLSLDLDTLFFIDKAMAASDTVCNITMRSPESYNAIVPAGKRLRMTGRALSPQLQKRSKIWWSYTSSTASSGP